jgi:hypothetical protein
VKTGWTGRTVLLPSDDAGAYRRHIAAYETEYKPVGLRECELVQSLADTQWRLNRISGLEMAIYAIGHVEFSGTIEPEKIELTTHLKYEKQLRNLQLQETRLVRRFHKEMAELRELQKERQAWDETELASNFQTANDPRLCVSAQSLSPLNSAQVSPEMKKAGGALAPPAFWVMIWSKRLPVDRQRVLDAPHLVRAAPRGTRDLPRSGTSDVRVGRTQIGVVEQVRRVRAQRELEALGDRELFHDRGVDVVEPWSDQSIDRIVAEGIA